MDIDALINQAEEMTLPLLQYTLRLSDPTRSLPAGYEEKIKGLRKRIAARKIVLFEELKKILAAFTESDIETIVLKGVMMQKIYPPGVRAFGDMDILIKKEKLPHARDILERFGYTLYAPQLHAGVEVFQGALRYIKNEFYPIIIEPHWTLGLLYPYSSRIPIDDLWQRAIKINIARIDTLVLSPEDALLHLCLHFLQHRSRRFIHPLCDIAALIHHQGEMLNWNGFLARVSEYKLFLPVRYSLQKTYELFKPSIPSVVFDRLGAHKPGRVERWVFNELEKSRDEESKKLVHFLIIPMALKLRYLWYKFFPSREFLINRYPELQGKDLVFCYMYRLRDMLAKGVRGLASLITRKK